MPRDLADIPEQITVARAVAWLAPRQGDELTLDAAGVDADVVQALTAKALGIAHDKATHDPPDAAPDGTCPLYDLVLIKREQPDRDQQSHARTLTKSKDAPRMFAKSDVKRVIWYPLYVGPEEDDAHGERMSEDDLLEMTWASYGNQKITVEHGFDQGLRKIFEKDELDKLEGQVVEHYTLERDMAAGEEWRGATLSCDLRKNTPIEAIRYSPEVYAILSQIDHGLSLEGEGRTEKR